MSICFDVKPHTFWTWTPHWQSYSCLLPHIVPAIPAQESAQLPLGLKVLSLTAHWHSSETSADLGWTEGIGNSNSCQLVVVPWICRYHQGRQWSIGSFDRNLAIAADAKDSGMCLRIRGRLVVVHLSYHTLLGHYPNSGMFDEIGRDCKGLGTTCPKPVRCRTKEFQGAEADWKVREGRMNVQEQTAVWYLMSPQLTTPVRRSWRHSKSESNSYIIYIMEKQEYMIPWYPYRRVTTNQHRVTWELVY